MPKSGVLLLAILLVGGLYGLWQNRSESIQRDLPSVHAVSVSLDGVLTISGALAQDCLAAPSATTTRFPHNLDIQLVRERSSLSACGLQADKFDLEVETEWGSVPPYVIINGAVWARDSAETGGEFEAQSLFPANIDAARIEVEAAESGAYRLSVRGSQGVGCDLLELFSWRESDERVMIGVYNAMPVDSVCPDMLVEIDETFSLPATNLGEEALFAVNNVLIEELEKENVSEKDKVLTNIFRVDVKVTGTRRRQISLDVAGEHPDGCDFPVKVAQSRDGDSIEVEVYREVPADVFCPMILRPYQGTIQLEGDFESGAYTIKVNAHSQRVDI